jgi:hypothetical protein
MYQMKANAPHKFSKIFGSSNGENRRTFAVRAQIESASRNAVRRADERISRQDARTQRKSRRDFQIHALRLCALALKKMKRRRTKIQNG